MKANNKNNNNNNNNNNFKSSSSSSCLSGSRRSNSRHHRQGHRCCCCCCCLNRSIVHWFVIVMIVSSTTIVWKCSTTAAAFVLTTKSTTTRTTITTFSQQNHHHGRRFYNKKQSHLFLSSSGAEVGQPTELPDSLDDAAEIAASSSAMFAKAMEGGSPRCRVDFDTSVGDETYPLLKTSSEFVQKYVTALCYALIPGIQQQRQEEMMKVVQARTELRQLQQREEEEEEEEEEENEEEAEAAAEAEAEAEEKESNNSNNGSSSSREERKRILQEIIRNGGRDPNWEWDGPIVRIYFPDEGNAALARRDWNPKGHPDNEALVPPCVEFSSCGGIQLQDVTNDQIVIFFCPKASESESVEQLLQQMEEQSQSLSLVVFVNPNLVDMGVTGFGMAGRLLRERLIDNLTYTYYLRTLSWGALTRVWPKAFSVWQEDENANGGYRLIQSMDRLPSNPEVEDIYDMENGLMAKKQSGGMLDQLGDFMNGMMKL